MKYSLARIYSSCGFYACPQGRGWIYVLLHMFLTTHSRMRTRQAGMLSLAVVLLLHLVAFTVTPYLHLALQPTGTAKACCPASENTGEGIQAARFRNSITMPTAASARR